MTERTIEDAQAGLVQEFQALSDWQARYRRIIERGRALDGFPDEFRTDRNRVKGCQSQVWLHAVLDDRGRVVLLGDSDSTLVRGLVAMVIEVFQGQPPSVLATAPVSFLDELGLIENLSQTRSSGLAAMLRQVRAYGVAFDALQRLGRA
jgi:cysteine desulfuration protein SufE